MRHLIKFALLAGAALAVSACSKSAPPANNVANEVVDNGIDSLGNDASAVESVTNAPLAPPPAESNAASNDAAPTTAPPPPSTPNVESNVAGM